MAKTFNPYKMAKALGFDEAMANQFARCGTDKDGILKIAKAQGLLSTKPTISKPEPEATPPPEPEPELKQDSEPEPKKHKHSYRKDGTCACGKVRKAKK